MRPWSSCGLTPRPIGRAWCSAPVCSPNALWKHCSNSPIPFRSTCNQLRWHRQACGRPARASMVATRKLRVAGNGNEVLVNIQPARDPLTPFQDPSTRVSSVKEDGATDFWIKEQRDNHTLLSIGDSDHSRPGLRVHVQQLWGDWLKEVQNGWKSLPLRSCTLSQMPRHTAHDIPWSGRRAAYKYGTEGGHAILAKVLGGQRRAGDVRLFHLSRRGYLWVSLVWNYGSGRKLPQHQPIPWSMGCSLRRQRTMALGTACEQMEHCPACHPKGRVAMPQLVTRKRAVAVPQIQARCKKDRSRMIWPCFDRQRLKFSGVPLSSSTGKVTGAAPSIADPSSFPPLASSSMSSGVTKKPPPSAPAKRVWHKEQQLHEAQEILLRRKAPLSSQSLLSPSSQECSLRHQLPLQLLSRDHLQASEFRALDADKVLEQMRHMARLSWWTVEGHCSSRSCSLFAEAPVVAHKPALRNWMTKKGGLPLLLTVRGGRRAQNFPVW